MNFDNVPHYLAQKEEAKQAFFTREGRWPIHGEWIAEICQRNGCTDRTVRRWEHRTKETEVWVSRQPAVPEVRPAATERTG